MTETNEKTIEVGSLVGKGGSANATETNHINSVMNKLCSLESLLEEDIIGTNNKGRDIHRAKVYAFGPSLTEGINSICIGQVRTSLWGGKRFHNSKSDNILGDFRDSTVDLGGNMNKSYRFAFYKIGDKTDINKLVEHFAKSEFILQNVYSNDPSKVLTEEQFAMMLTGTLDPVKVADKLTLRDKDLKLILDMFDKKVFRQTFVKATYVDDINDVAWKRKAKETVVSAEALAEKFKAIIA